jgi:hypothetical protein
MYRVLLSPFRLLLLPAPALDKNIQLTCGITGREMNVTGGHGDRSVSHLFLHCFQVNILDRQPASETPCVPAVATETRLQATSIPRDEARWGQKIAILLSLKEGDCSRTQRVSLGGFQLLVPMRARLTLPPIRALPALGYKLGVPIKKLGLSFLERKYGMAHPLSASRPKG